MYLLALLAMENVELALVQRSHQEAMSLVASQPAEPAVAILAQLVAPRQYQFVACIAAILI